MVWTFFAAFYSETALKLVVQGTTPSEQLSIPTNKLPSSQARKFTSLVKMVSYYRHKDLTENFNYEALRGVSLRTPYKDI